MKIREIALFFALYGLITYGMSCMNFSISFGEKTKSEVSEGFSHFFIGKPRKYMDMIMVLLIFQHRANCKISIRVLRKFIKFKGNLLIKKDECKRKT